MILNEFEIAERVMQTKVIEKKEELFVVAKYLRNEVGCDETETIAILNTIMKSTYRNYNPIKSVDYLCKVSKKVLGKSLVQIESILVTKKELLTIRSVDNPKLQRLLFALLVHAKYSNKLSADNNNWCNISINELYRSAKVSTRNFKEKGIFLHRLKNLGLIFFSLKNTNLNIRCLFVDKEKNDDDLEIVDLRELGYQYLAIDEPNHFLHCQECGVIIRRKNRNDHSTKYCGACLNAKKYDWKKNSFLKM